MMTTEMQGRVVHMCRGKGYKGHAEYEEVKGFEAQHLGHTITVVFDPDPVSATGFISGFTEPQEAAEFLTYKQGSMPPFLPLVLTRVPRCYQIAQTNFERFLSRHVLSRCTLVECSVFLRPSPYCQKVPDIQTLIIAR